MIQQYKIEGVVVDRENNPIEGVLVRIYRGSFGQVDQMGEERTRPDGRYEISFDGGSPIRILRYDFLLQGLDSCHPSLVDYISGTQDHTLHKVLSRVGMAYDTDELLEILSTYERVYCLDVSHHVALEEIKSQYRGNLGMIKYIDEMSRQRYYQVIALYEQ
jgi:hypothetical protein